MDNVCHTLVGAALAAGGLKHRSRFARTALMVASNLPDLDVLVFATSVPSVAFRRGWTHGTVAQLVLPFVLTGALCLADRVKPSRPGEGPVQVWWLLLMSCLGVCLHVAFDWLNNYGVRLFMPFDRRWFYGDTLFIVDPWLWLALGVGVWLSGRRGDVRPARWALLTATVYIVAMCAAAQAARANVADAWRAEGRAEPSGLMVGPVPVNPFRREVIVDAGDRYATGVFTWFPATVRFDQTTILKNEADPRVMIARETPAIQGFLVWSRFPFWTFDRTAEGTMVTLSDMRFRDRGRPFVQTVLVR